MLQKKFSPIAGLFGVVIFAGLLVGSVRLGSAETIQFTDSNQLNLSGRVVLGAVNFYYDPATAGDPAANAPMTGTIQGVTFQDVNVTPGNVTNFALTAGGTLTTALPATGSEAYSRAQWPSTTITGTGADEAQAEKFATALITFGTYFGGESGSLTFGFGPGYANADVEVQMVGGDSIAAATNLTASVGGSDKGSIVSDNDGTTAHLLTFDATTDASGGLLVDLVVDSGGYCGLSGVIVTIPEPSTLALLGMGALALLLVVCRRRK